MMWMAYVYVVIGLVLIYALYCARVREIDDG